MLDWTKCKLESRLPRAEKKIARRTINNLRSADDTPLMAESKDLKSLLMKVNVEF